MQTTKHNQLGPKSIHSAQPHSKSKFILEQQAHEMNNGNVGYAASEFNHGNVPNPNGNNSVNVGYNQPFTRNHIDLNGNDSFGQPVVGGARLSVGATSRLRKASKFDRPSLPLDLSSGHTQYQNHSQLQPQGQDAYVNGFGQHQMLDETTAALTSYSREH